MGFLIRFIAPIIALVGVQKTVEATIDETVDYFTDEEQGELLGPEAPTEKSLMPEFGFYKKSKADEWIILTISFYAFAQVIKGINNLTK